MRNELREIVRNAIDLHVHVGPEIIPRKFTAQTLYEVEKGKLAGCVLKNHFYPSLPPVLSDEMTLYGSVVLNAFVGGLNPHAVYAAALISPTPLFVWFPTLHTEQFLAKSAWEIPKEWVGRDDFAPRPSTVVAPVRISHGNRLCAEVGPVLQAIAEAKAVLCTGHMRWQESCLLVKEARKYGIDKIVITHPIYQKIAMPIEVQVELAQAGCLIEHCYSMHSIDRVPIAKIAQQIRAVGVQNVVLSSDVGQAFSPSPSEALIAFGELLIEEGIMLDDLKRMLCDNPRRLL